MSTDDHHDYCTDCGWGKYIVHTEQQGKQTIKLCKECAQVRTGAIDVIDSLNQIPRRKKRKLAAGTTSEAQRIRRAYRAGFLLGIVLGSGIAFAFFNFIRAWS